MSINIKVFDKNTKLDVTNLMFNSKIILDINNLIFLTSTKIVDKLQKEIFEGYYLRNGSQFYEVVFSEGIFFLRNIFNSNNVKRINNANEMIVVGNIIQHTKQNFIQC